MTTAKLSKALRAVGEDLEIRGIRCLDLRCEGDTCIVQCGYQQPPAPTPLTLHYAPDDIEHLDREGREKRQDFSPAKDFLTLSHILRGIGWYLDKRNARLLRISNNESPGTNMVFRIEYETDEGGAVVEERPVSSLYDICVNMYKQRGKDTRFGAKTGRWRR